jgi:hypothetical protein
MQLLLLGLLTKAIIEQPLVALQHLPLLTPHCCWITAAAAAAAAVGCH